MINDAGDVFKLLSADSEETAKRHLFKWATECGAWINFEETGVRIGSIVEGSDTGTASYRLEYPFSSKAFYERIEAIEKEADAVWEWANTEHDGQTAADQGIDFPDVAFDYKHLNPIFGE